MTDMPFENPFTGPQLTGWDKILADKSSEFVNAVNEGKEEVNKNLADMPDDLLRESIDEIGRNFVNFEGIDYLAMDPFLAYVSGLVIQEFVRRATVQEVTDED